MQGGAGGRGTARVALARCHSPVPHPSEPPLGEQWFCPGSWAGLCCEECFIGEKKKRFSKGKRSVFLDRTASCSLHSQCWGLGQPGCTSPPPAPPFVLQLRDPNPDRHPEAGAVQLNAQRGSSGRARSQESPWGWSSTKTAPSHPRLAEPGAAVLVWSWWHRGQRGLGRTGAPCRGRGHEEHSEAGSCPPAPCHTTTGGH